MIRRLLPAWLVLLALPLAAAGEDYHVAKGEALPAGEIAPEIASRLQPTSVAVVKGDSRPTCEVWLAKEWPIAADAKTGGDILYPLTAGELFGAIRFPRKASDFRDQDIPAGIYVLRYAQQPVDGAHVGTSPTRDFLALLPAAKDRDAKTLDYKTLVNISKETTGTAHPAILSLQKGQGEGAEPSVHEDADHEWVLLHVVGKMKQGDAVKDLPIDIVVVGKAAE
jgi:hypothetical protein